MPLDPRDALPLPERTPELLMGAVHLRALLQWEGGRNMALNREIDVRMGRSLYCSDQGRHNDGYVCPHGRDDFVIPPNYTGSIDAAAALIDLLGQDVLHIMSNAVQRCIIEERPKALPARMCWLALKDLTI